MAFHFFHVTEIYSNADGSVQYIELQGEANGQNLLNGHTITVDDGSITHTFTFPGNLPSATTLGQKMLLATQKFSDLGIVAPNYIIDENFLFTAGGTITFPADTATHDIHGYNALPGGIFALSDGNTSIINSPGNFSGDTGSIPGNPVVGTDTANTLTGTAAKDFMVGLGGSDVINGGGGNDTMVGGAGNDIFSVNSAGDVVTEASGTGSGTDTVRSTVTETLDANVERLMLLGSSAINGTGNASNNVLTGNSGNNVLNGLGGTDTLRGLGGNDTMVWASTDSYDGGAGVDILKINGGNLNLTQLLNTRILNTETMNMTGLNNNTVILNAQDVLDLSSTTNQVTVLGNVGDTVDLRGTGWALDSTVGAFEFWKNGLATVKVETELAVL